MTKKQKKKKKNKYYYDYHRPYGKALPHGQRTTSDPSTVKSNTCSPRLWRSGAVVLSNKSNLSPFLSIALRRPVLGKPVELLRATDKNGGNLFSKHIHKTTLHFINGSLGPVHNFSFRDLWDYQSDILNRMPIRKWNNLKAPNIQRTQDNGISGERWILGASNLTVVWWFWIVCYCILKSPP